MHLRVVRINLKEFLQEQKLHSERETWAKMRQGNEKQRCFVQTCALSYDVIRGRPLTNRTSFLRPTSVCSQLSSEIAFKGIS